MADLHRVVILGGGFGGLSAAHKLKHAPVEITLLDRCNYHLFQPLLYQVATGSLSLPTLPLRCGKSLPARKIRKFCWLKPCTLMPRIGALF